MEFGGQSLALASETLVMKELPALGGDGGLIAVDKNGNIALPFCTEGMYRGFIKKENQRAQIVKDILIFK
jgi:beta-aspartyl-peptidase (threonine type)